MQQSLFLHINLNKSDHLIFPCITCLLVSLELVPPCTSCLQKWKLAIIPVKFSCLHLEHIMIYLCICFSAVCPYLALETSRQWRLSTKTVNLMKNGKMPTVSIEQAQKNYCKVSSQLQTTI